MDSLQIFWCTENVIAWCMVVEGQKFGGWFEADRDDEEAWQAICKEHAIMTLEQMDQEVGTLH